MVRVRALEKEKTFKTEAELCAAFITALPSGWVAYAETAGWDILLARKKDGFQIGIQAKLRLNVDVVNQTIDSDASRWTNHIGPDCRAVLVPDLKGGGLERICAFLGITVLTMRSVGKPPYWPALPRDHETDLDMEWFESCPRKRHTLPEFVPDVPAGASAPLQLTSWKIGAIKLLLIIELRGYITREDFKHVGIDHRRWLAPGSTWLTRGPKGFVAGPRIPQLEKQHPKVFAEIRAKAAEWMPKEPA